MLRRALHNLCLLLLLSLSCRADLTLRYTMELKIGSALPPAVVDTMKQATTAFPKEMLLRIKGDKTLTGFGPFVAIFDNTGTGIILLNPATKQYARTSMADYLSALQAATPPIAAMPQGMPKMKVDVQSNKTGQVGMVSGIRADEHVRTMTMSMELPGQAAMAGPLMRMEMHTWIASPDDLTRIPALGQYASYAQRALSLFNPQDLMQKVFSQMPGLGEQMSSLTQDIAKDAGNLTVKSEALFYVPMLAQLQQMQQQSNAPKSDPNAPFMEMRMNLAEISSDAIDDAIFDVPADYQMASTADLVKAVMPAAAAKASAPSVAPQR